MMFTYNRTFRIYNMKFLHVTLVILSLQTRITHCPGVPSTGLYFMLNGTIHLPGDSVLVSDIGPQPDNRNDSGSTLVCVTTNVNTACCRNNDNNDMGAVGDWYYPNITKVPRGSVSKELKLRGIGYTHQVRLARSPDSTPPPGVYTCIVPEPVTGVFHNASISIDMDSQIVVSPPPPVVSLTAPGPALEGSEVILNCSRDVMGSFVWNHSSISDLSSGASVAIYQDASGVYIVLTISSVLISHAGTYSCEVSAARVSSTTSITLRVQLTPPTSVKVTSLNLLGFSLTLTCCVGVVAILEPGVQVQVQWTDSSGGAVDGKAPAIGSGTSYTSQLTLATTEESIVGVNYTCTASLVSTLAFIDSSGTVSNSTTIPPQTAYIQAKFEEVSNCISWKSCNARDKTDDVINEFVRTVSSSCGCGFNSGHLTDSVFLCSLSSPNSVTYQAQLHGTPLANVSQLIKIIEEELLQEKVSIKVQFSLLTIQKICIVPYGTERPCDDVSSASTEVMASCVGIITGITTAFIIIILVMGVTIVVLIIKIVHDKKKVIYHPNDVAIISESKSTSSGNREGKKINLDNDNLKMVQDGIETNDCEAYGVAPSALTTSSRMDYEHVF